MGFLRRIFGLPSKRQQQEEAEGADQTAQWLTTKDRYWRMASIGSKDSDCQLKDIVYVLNGAIQEIEFEDAGSLRRLANNHCRYPNWTGALSTAWRKRSRGTQDTLKISKNSLSSLAPNGVIGAPFLER